jgi:quercetin dioxygenase-like cupin family protein
VRALWHRHEKEQLLIVTAGSGVIGDRHAEWRVSAGDVVIVAAGEEHWHGASSSESLTHIAVLLSAETTLLEAVDAQHP